MTTYGWVQSLDSLRPSPFYTQEKPADKLTSKAKSGMGGLVGWSLYPLYPTLPIYLKLFSEKKIDGIVSSSSLSTFDRFRLHTVFV